MKKTIVVVVLAIEAEMVFAIKNVKMTRQQFSQVERLLDDVQEINEVMEEHG